jgi:glycosyltransferase involved in cell wall biosynthesis
VYHSVQLGLPAVRRFPAVLTIHDLAPLRWPSHYLRLPYSRVGHAWQYALAKHADAIVAVSEATKADVVARLGIHPERIRVIPEAVDSSFHPPSKLDGASIAREGFGIPDRYVLYVGQFDPRKNMDGLFAAFARAADRDPDLRLVIVGTLGKLAGLMRDALARSRVDPARVVITGTVDDATLAALYAGAECLLHAAWLEGFGLTALESLAAGTPVVGYRAGAVAEVVGDAGLLVDERDGAALGEALAAFLDDPPLQAELRVRAKPRAAHFSWDRAADDTLAIYRSLT